MATDLSVKVIEADTAIALDTAITSYLTTGGWNKADVVSCSVTSNVAGTKFTATLLHLTTPTP